MHAKKYRKIKILKVNWYVIVPLIGYVRNFFVMLLTIVLYSFLVMYLGDAIPSLPIRSVLKGGKSYTNIFPHFWLT